MEKIKNIQKILSILALLISIIIFLFEKSMVPVACYVLLCGIYAEIQAL